MSCTLEMMVLYKQNSYNDRLGILDLSFERILTSNYRLSHLKPYSMKYCKSRNYYMHSHYNFRKINGMISSLLFHHRNILLYIYNSILFIHDDYYYYYKYCIDSMKSKSNNYNDRASKYSNQYHKIHRYTNSY
jgi:hypothetical protein